MNMLLMLVAAQIVLGGLDNLVHHELIEKLAARVSARKELALHGVRELIYAALFIVLAWATPHGLWAWTLLALLLVETGVTLADFIEEDRTRTLAPLERVLHTILALNFGVMLAVGAPLWFLWRAAPTAFIASPHGLVSWFLTLSALGVGAWGLRDCAASMALYARAARDEKPPVPSGRTILVTGATGFIGEPFVRGRLSAGDRVIVLSRDPKRASALFGGRVLAVSDLAVLPENLKIDAVVNLAGAGVANALWTPRRKRELLASRLYATQGLEVLMSRLAVRPQVFISASAIGYYGDRSDAALTESAPPGSGFTSELCTKWEAAAAAAGLHAGRCVRIRFGLILGRDGGAWPRLALSLPFKLAAQFGSGDQWMSWIHKQDALGLLEHALFDAAMSGAVNAVAPQETRHGEVIGAMAALSGTWFIVAVPAWLLRLGLGELSHLFLDSQRVLPRAAGASGFVFAFPTIESAAMDLLGVDRGREGATAINVSS